MAQGRRDRDYLKGVGKRARTCQDSGARKSRKLRNLTGPRRANAFSTIALVCYG
jgi:hypothetical protein